MNGADLYVARLGRIKIAVGHGKSLAPKTTTAAETASITETGNLQSISASASTTTPSGNGSLHDELINKRPSTVPNICSLEHSSYPDNISASRPCYRCITYMDSVGIKRVFWTNDAGQWEGGKVRDLIDALDNSMGSVATGGPTGNGIFVTKHEVLMLKRAMGQ